MMERTVVERGNTEIGIVVADLEASTPFYRDGLGLTDIEDRPGPKGLARRFACGETVLKLLRTERAPETSNPPGGMDGGAIGLRWITIAVDDVEETFARCLATGAKVLAPVQEWKPGNKVAAVEDPNGVFVELVPRLRRPDAR